MGVSVWVGVLQLILVIPIDSLIGGKACFMRKRAALSLNSAVELSSIDLDELGSKDILQVVKNTDRGVTATLNQRNIVSEWISLKGASQYKEAEPVPAGKLLGNYEVSYVGQGDSQRGNPAGGSFRGFFGRLLYKVEGVYQHILLTDNTTATKVTLSKERMPKDTSNSLVVINFIVGKLFSFIPMMVILRGLTQSVTLQQRLDLMKSSGIPLTATTVRADFESPLIGFGSAHPGMGLTARVGPESSVILDTPYIDDTLRVGVGSRGSLFLFKRLQSSRSSGEFERSDRWRKCVVRRPVRAAKVGVGFVIAGALSVLLRNTVLLRSTAGYSGMLALRRIGIALIALGAILLTSKGGIIDDDAPA